MDKISSHRLDGTCFVFAILAALTAAPSTLAADMPSPAPVHSKAPVPVANDWTGFYLGGGVGTRSANISEQTLSATFNGVSFMDPADCTTGCGTQSLDHTAFRFSPYFGYNWQIAAQWLVGLEADAGFGSKTSIINGALLPGAGRVSALNAETDFFAVKTSWDVSARARVGYLVTPDLLVYATGGAAWQHIGATSTCGPFNDTIGCVGGPGNGSLLFTGSVADSRTQPGYTVGGGIETMAWGHWLLRGEFRYSDFGTITNTDVRTRPFDTSVVTTSYKLRLTTETALVGLAYKF